MRMITVKPLHLLCAIAVVVLSGGTDACSDGTCQLLDPCSSDSDCASGLYCTSCDDIDLRCVRDQATNPFQIVNGSLPFNKYSFLTTHNSFAIDDGTPRLTLTNQEDTITQQLNNGVRGFMLDTYDFNGDVWLCHSTGGECYDFTAFGPAIDTLKEIEAFLSANPTEIVTLILEDYVHAPNGLTNVFTAAGLMKYWFPLSKMPKNGGDWPLVSEMVANNQRLLVFTSISTKEQTEGIAYEWNYIVENQYGDGGMKAGSCPNRAESSALNDLSKSLVLENFFRSFPVKLLSCGDNSDPLSEMIKTCHAAAGNRWANFLAVDFYKRSDGGGAFQDVDTLNGGLICNCNDIHACQLGATPQACNQSLEVHL